MTVTSIKDAWTEAGRIFPTDYEYSAERSERAGYTNSSYNLLHLQLRLGLV